MPDPSIGDCEGLEGANTVASEPSGAHDRTAIQEPSVAGNPTKRNSSTGFARATTEALGDIGPYHLIRKIGEGGMGEVYEAEQSAPVRRRVAVKIVKHGANSQSVLDRFEAERQALALMNHPYVAKVYDGGSSTEGVPYFVMEFVEGVGLNEHCDTNRLSIDERLRIFTKVCDGVQHAHQNAIIHRDLKPSNIMVSEMDGEMIPKVIDFGIAKALDEKLTDLTLTQEGALLGTPSHMSPEQARGEHVDTRTDVYSLGVILYELLVGVLPFELRGKGLSGLEEFLHDLRSLEAVLPSAQLSTNQEQGLHSAKRRGVDLPSLRRQLKGELDWIVSKTLHKDRSERYGSPQELAADLRRYLAKEPVLAGPQGRSYRIRKFILRHRLGVSLAVVSTLVLIAFAATMTMQRATIARERDRANLEAESSRRVSNFLTNIFKVSNPSEARGNEVTARELLDRSAAEINALAEQPQLQARLQQTMGTVYQSLGLPEKAESLLLPAMEMHKKMLGPLHQETLATMHNLAIVYREQGRSEDAEALYLSVLAGREKTLGKQHPETLLTLNNLANLYLQKGDYDQARPIYEKLLSLHIDRLGNEDPETIVSMHNLANFHRVQGHYDQAEPLYTKALAYRRKTLGEEHPDTLNSMNSVARLLHAQKRYEKSRQLFVRTLAGRKNVLGDEHPSTLATMDNLANLYVDERRFDEANALFIESLDRRRASLGEQHPDTLNSMNNLANLYLQQEDFVAAEPLLVQTFAIRKRLLGDKHPDTAISIHNLACGLTGLGKLVEAEGLFVQAQKLFVEGRGPEHWLVAENLEQWAKLKRIQGHGDEAAAFESQAQDIRGK